MICKKVWNWLKVPNGSGRERKKNYIHKEKLTHIHECHSVTLLSDKSLKVFFHPDKKKRKSLLVEVKIGMKRNNKKQRNNKSFTTK